MAEFKPNARNVRTLLKSKRVEAALMGPANKYAQALQQVTPQSNRKGGGGTARSTKVEPGHKSASGDRVAVRVSQTSYSGRGRPRGGAAAPLQFGNAITDAVSHFDKAAKAMGG